MHHIVIVKAAHHMDNGIGHANVAEKLVAQAFPLRGASHQTSNVNELNHGRNIAFGAIEPRQKVHAWIRNGNHTHIGLNGTEGIVRRLGAGVGNGIKQGAFSHVGKSNNSKLHRIKAFLILSIVSRFACG
ncbi:hypothetical protein SDC9_200292 [bioreactor metagenome]|uniref:Uncharacterized protein n=1 Tax=bioreactor metagenome TaxID=1076179 RepID=A0A645INF4_9ZZZZ